MGYQSFGIDEESMGNARDHGNYRLRFHFTFEEDLSKPAPPPDEMRPVEADDRIYYDDATAFRDSARLTITDPETWRSAWLRATQAQATPPALPTVDFQRHMLVLVSAGSLKPGDEIHVDSVGLQRGRPVVVVRTTIECQPFPGTAYPLEIVRMRRSDSVVTFLERRSKTEDC